MLTVPTFSVVGRRLIARKSTLSLFDQLIVSATNFLTGAIIGRAGTQEEFGLYLLGFTAISLGLLIQASLVSSPYMVFSPRLDETERVEYSGSALFQQLCLSMGVVFCLVILASIMDAVGGPEGLGRVVWVLAVLSSFILFREFARRICFANLDFADAVRLDIATGVLQIGGLFVLAWRWQVTAWASYVVIGLASAVAAGAWIAHKHGWFAISIPRMKKDIRLNWDLGKWLAASALLWESNVVVYPWLLTYFHGTAAAGIWAACFGVIALANPLMLGMQNSLGPQMAHAFAEGGLPKLTTTMFRGAAVFSLLVAPLSIIIILFGADLITLIYGSKYTGYGLVVVPLAIELLVSPARFVISRALVVTGNSRLDFATNVISLLVMFMLGIMLVKRFGPLGVAVAILTGSVAVMLAKYWVAYYAIRNKNRTLEL